ncbi:unnamed protein product [Owenia fusiformis]|uniref:Conserved oligomeric Golgi complex subunit 4 n=1 Tax=Owenia fusiformis TaxID=6347 RepID=A0A8J1TUL1_OWEFU|nr:unnamed protein product [Owenia fusiformis]
MAAPSGSSATSNMSIQSIDNLTNLDDIKKAYEQLCLDEAAVTDEVNALFEQQGYLETKMSSLHKMLPNLQLVQTDSQQLSNMISFTSTLAENVSGKVRQLDLAKSHVTLCMQRVEDICDLKFCTEGVQNALKEEDYETAAGHVHKFLSLDENVLRMSADVSEGNTLDTSFKLLHEAESKLKSIVNNRFDAAVHAGDSGSVTRYFKIFPLLGLHEEGLKKFSKYLCAQIGETAAKNLDAAISSGVTGPRANVVFADTITMLYESIARLVEVHQPLVETYYGPGRMFSLMKYIQSACDREARKIIEEFKSARQYQAKVQSIEQSFMLNKSSTTERIEPKQLDVLLVEMTLLNSRTELFLRFVRRRITADMEVSTESEENQKSKLEDVEKFMSSTELSRLLQELLGAYIMMEEYFMREMLTKAVNMDTAEPGSQTSSMVDDTFFIVKKCVRRAMSSSSIDGVCAMLNHTCTLLEQDYREVLYGRLRAGFPSGFDFQQAYNLVQTSFQQGKLQGQDNEKQKSLFLTSLNNAEVSSEFIQTLKKSLEEEASRLYAGSTEHVLAKLESCLSDLGLVSNKFNDVLDFGFSQLSSNAVKPQVKPWVDSFLSTSHMLTEDDFSNFEANDPWVQTFIVNLDSLLSAFKASLTGSNYDRLVSELTNEVTAQLEKDVKKTTFNRLGGLQFDKDLRSLVGYLTSVTTWTIRDKFARLTQMATILNLERVSEILDYWGANSGPLTWRLTPNEVRQVLALRNDFRNEDIRRLKL